VNFITCTAMNSECRGSDISSIWSKYVDKEMMQFTG